VRAPSAGIRFQGSGPRHAIAAAYGLLIDCVCPVACPPLNGISTTLHPDAVKLKNLSFVMQKLVIFYGRF
jgi:hypothetical protein